MKKFLHDISLRAVKLVNIVMMTLPFALSWYLFYADRIDEPFYKKGNWLMVVLFLIIYATYSRIYDALRVSLSRVSELVYSQCLAALISDAIAYVVTWLLTKHLPNPIPLLIALVIQCLISIIWSYLAHKWYYFTFPAKKSLVVYDNRLGMEQLIKEYGLQKKFDIRATVSSAECISDLGILEGIDAVFLSGVRSADRNVILKYCIENDIHVYVVPRVGDVIMSSAKQMHMLHLPMLRVERYSPNPEFLIIKRLSDIVLSSVAIILLSPVMAVTAIAIKLTDRGPVFYKQCRLTKDGKKFNVLKFRSMRVDAEKDGVARLSSGDNDDRITPVGKIIRKCRIDELPQLFNILGGSMSIVGPRPERPEIAEQYEKEMPEFRLRLQAKAGLTGYAQIYGKYNTIPYDKLQMDLMYIAKPSFVEDLRLMFATIKILFMPDSTEGVAQGQTTAMADSSDRSQKD